MSGTQSDPSNGEAQNGAPRQTSSFCWRCLFAALPPLLLTLLFGWFAGASLERGRMDMEQHSGGFQEEAEDLFEENARLRLDIGAARQELAAARAALATGEADGLETLIDRIAALPIAERAALLRRAGADLIPAPSTAPEILDAIEVLAPQRRADVFDTLPASPFFNSWFEALDIDAKRAWLARFLGDAAVSTIEINGVASPALLQLRQERAAALKRFEEQSVTLAAAQKRLEAAGSARDATLKSLRDKEKERVEALSSAKRAAEDRDAAQKALATEKEQGEKLRAALVSARSDLHAARVSLADAGEAREAAAREAAEENRRALRQAAEGARAALARDPVALLRRIAAFPARERRAVYANLTESLPADPGYAAWLETNSRRAMAAFSGVIEPGAATPQLQSGALEIPEQPTQDPRIASLQSRLAGLRDEREQARRVAAEARRLLEAAQKEKAAVDADLASARGELASLKARVAGLERDLDKRGVALESAETALRERAAALAEERRRYEALTRSRAALASELSAAKETAQKALEEAESGRGAAMAAMKRADAGLNAQLEAATKRADAAAKEAEAARAALKQAERKTLQAEEKAASAAEAFEAEQARAQAAERQAAQLDAALASARAAAERRPAAPAPALSLPEIGVISLDRAPLAVAERFSERDAEIASLREGVAALRAEAAALQRDKTTLSERLEEAQTARVAATKVEARRPQSASQTAATAALAPNWRAAEIADVASDAPPNIAASVRFESASAALTRAGRRAVRRLGIALVKAHRQNPNASWRLVVEGHTDQLPMRGREFPSNWALSAARAATVTQYLTYLGVPQDRLTAVGFGASQPKDPRWTREAFKANRRIELRMLTPS